MKYIYITMVQLPTFANKCVKIFTNFDYSHSSISFSENLETLYSFQIKNRKAFLVGGFVEETHDTYFHGKDVSLKEMVFKIPVEDDKYDEVVNFINTVKNDKEYMFNYVSALFMFVFGGVKSYKAYHCIEFITEVLNHTETIVSHKPSHKMKPKDLYELLKYYKIKDEIINFRDFQPKQNPFMKKLKMGVKIKKSIYSVREAICRFVLQRPTRNFNYKYINFYDEDCI